MTLPVTFSPPGTEHEPSIEDALQLALWLALRADNVNAAYYAYNRENHAAGVRIVMDREETAEGGRIVLPQQIVKIGYGNNAFTYKVTGGGTKRVEVVIIHLEKRTTELVDEHRAPVQDVTTTALMLMARTEEILMRGTLYEPGQLTNDARLIDPFRSAVYTEDGAPSPELVGAYVPASPQMRTLNTKAPAFRRGVGEWFLPRLAKVADVEKLDLSRDLALAFFVFATYEINVPDREDMTRGGFNA